MASGLLLWLRYVIGPSYPWSSLLPDNGLPLVLTDSDFKSDACISFPWNNQLMVNWMKLCSDEKSLLPVVSFVSVFVLLAVFVVPTFAASDWLRELSPFWKRKEKVWEKSGLRERIPHRFWQSLVSLWISVWNFWTDHTLYFKDQKYWSFLPCEQGEMNRIHFQSHSEWIKKMKVWWWEIAITWGFGKWGFIRPHKVFKVWTHLSQMGNLVFSCFGRQTGLCRN